MQTLFMGIFIALTAVLSAFSYLPVYADPLFLSATGSSRSLVTDDGHVLSDAVAKLLLRDNPAVIDERDEGHGRFENGAGSFQLQLLPINRRQETQPVYSTTRYGPSSDSSWQDVISGEYASFERQLERDIIAGAILGRVS
jgi:hypothetical protein